MSDFQSECGSSNLPRCIKSPPDCLKNKEIEVGHSVQVCMKQFGHVCLRERFLVPSEGRARTQKAGVVDSIHFC